MTVRGVVSCDLRFDIVSTFSRIKSNASIESRRASRRARPTLRLALSCDPSRFAFGACEVVFVARGR